MSYKLISEAENKYLLHLASNEGDEGSLFGRQKAMNFFQSIRQLTFNPSLVKLVRIFNLGSLMKHVYYQIDCFKNRVKNVYFHGMKAQFFVKDFEELRIVETVFANGDRDESNILSPLLQMLQPGDTAYDIGANIGIHTIFMAKNVGEKGRVIAIEPENGSYRGLMQNIRLNGLNNVIPICVALGDRDSAGALYVMKKIGNDTASLIKSDESIFSQRIEIVRGDFLVQKRILPKPKAVKIDVEGYEYQVIKGLQKTLSTEICQLVCCEIHSHLSSSGANGSMILDLLKSLGFKKIESYNRGGEIHAICYKSGK